MTRVQLQLPPELTVEGFRERGTIWVESAGKAPKRRFAPGMYIRYQKQLYEIIYCYRLAKNPHEWIYACEMRKSVLPSQEVAVDRDDLTDLIEAMGAGSLTPRVVAELFRDTMQAMNYFSDIPAKQDRRHITNKELVQSAEVVSSGEVVW